MAKFKVADPNQNPSIPFKQESLKVLSKAGDNLISDSNLNLITETPYKLYDNTN